MKREKQFLSILLTVSMVLGLFPVSAFAAKNNTPFTDVNTGDWFYEAVEYVYECGMMSGTGETTFSPQTTTTRGMIVTILHRMEGTPEAAGEAFTDVDTLAYYADAVAWANESEIVGGYGNGKFGPNDPITREQMVAILYRYAQYLDMDLNVGEDTNVLSYGDAEKVSEWAVEALQWAVGAGLINGIDEKLEPQGSASRAQVATILMRFCENASAIEDTHTVTFQYNYGSKGVYEEVQVADGESAEKPDNPERKGYIFKGWYTEKSGGEKYGFNAPVIEDITLWARWQKISQGASPTPPIPEKEIYTVTFESNGGSPVDSQPVKKGLTASEPESPTMEAHIFMGWFTDSALTLSYDFTAPVTGNITLYAAWNPVEFEDNLADDIIDLGDIVNKETNGEIDVIYNKDGTVSVLDGTFTDKKVTSSADAAELLKQAASLFSEDFTAEENQITVNSVGTEGVDKELFYRYHSLIDGIPVLGSQIVLSTKEDGTVTGLFTSWRDDLIEVDTEASVTSEEAKAAAWDALLADDEMNDYLESLPEYETNTEETIKKVKARFSEDSQLFIYGANPQEKPLLVYAVIMSDSLWAENTEGTEGDSLLPSEISRTFYIYANGPMAGKLYLMSDNVYAIDDEWSDSTIFVENYSGTMAKLNVQKKNDMFRLKDAKRNITTYDGNGLIKVIATSSSFTEEDDWTRAVVTIHENMTKTYDYFKNVLGQTSFDGEGAIVKAIYDEDYKNATWKKVSSKITFGANGQDYFAALDVAAHEYTHASITHIIDVWGILPGGFSGAQIEASSMEESYGDILGSLVEGKTDDNFWKVGEDTGKVIRDMSDLAHYDNMSLDPHENGEIYNHAFYKMVTDSRTILVTNDEWATVFYRSLYRLTADATFLDGRGAVLASAKQAGFTKRELLAIREAFDAVGICEPENVRIVLTWGENPQDLDSHLVGPDIDSGRFHVYYGAHKHHAAELDYDDTTSYGPEVTTIHVLTDGDYYFYVHDFSNEDSVDSTEMAASEATVKIYWGADSAPQETYQIDTSSKGTYWNVFKLTVKDAEVKSIKELNTYGDSASYS